MAKSRVVYSGKPHMSLDRKKSPKKKKGKERGKKASDVIGLCKNQRLHEGVLKYHHSLHMKFQYYTGRDALHVTGSHEEA